MNMPDCFKFMLLNIVIKICCLASYPRTAFIPLTFQILMKLEWPKQSWPQQKIVRNEYVIKILQQSPKVWCRKKHVKKTVNNRWLSSCRRDRVGPSGHALGGRLVARLPDGILPYLPHSVTLLLLPQEHAQGGEHNWHTRNTHSCHRWTHNWVHQCCWLPAVGLIRLWLLSVLLWWDQGTLLPTYIKGYASGIVWPRPVSFDLLSTCNRLQGP